MAASHGAYKYNMHENSVRAIASSDISTWEDMRQWAVFEFCGCKLDVSAENAYLSFSPTISSRLGPVLYFVFDCVEHLWKRMGTQTCLHATITFFF